MEEYNAWENEKTFKDISLDELLKGIETDNINLVVGRSFVPGDKTYSYLEINKGEKGIAVNYTNQEHPITASNYYGVHISSEYFKEHENEIKEAYMKAYNRPHNSYLEVPSFMFSQELLDYLLTKKNASIILHDITLSNNQINQIKSNCGNVQLDGKRIHNGTIVGDITYDLLKNETDFTFSSNKINEFYYPNFKYFHDNTVFRFKDYNLKDVKRAIVGEEKNFKNIFNLLEKIDKLGKSFHFVIEVQKRSTLNKYLEKYKFKNINLRIINDEYEYSYQEYMEEEAKLDKLVEPIKNSNLSPYEKYLAVYDIVKKYKKYKENVKNRKEARNLKYIVDNKYMVCVGFSKLLETLLDKVGINANCVSVAVDVSYDKGFDEKNPKAKPTKRAWHQRVVFSMDDEKHNIHGLYMADPTWDNDLNKDYLNHSTMTFDNMTNAKRMFYFSPTSPILSFQSFSEYAKQVDYIINYWIKDVKSDYTTIDDEDAIIFAMRITTNYLLNGIACDKRIKYFIETLEHCVNQKDFENLLTELGNYLLKRINNPVDKETMFKAHDNVRKELYKEDTNTARKDYEERDLFNFPYEVPTEAHNISARR